MLLLGLLVALLRQALRAPLSFTSMAKKRRPPRRLSPEQAALLDTLFPAVELTPQVRPRLLLVIPLANGRLLLGLLYHTRKQAWQWRLDLRSATHQGFAHRTRWQRPVDVLAMALAIQTRQTEFAELAHQLGAPAPLRLEFPPQALDEEIVQILCASPLPELFR